MHRNKIVLNDILSFHLFRDRPIICADSQILTTFVFRCVGWSEVAGCSDFGPGNNPYT